MHRHDGGSAPRIRPRSSTITGGDAVGYVRPAMSSRQRIAQSDQSRQGDVAAGCRSRPSLRSPPACRPYSPARMRMASGSIGMKFIGALRDQLGPVRDHDRLVEYGIAVAGLRALETGARILVLEVASRPIARCPSAAMPWALEDQVDHVAAQAVVGAGRHGDAQHRLLLADVGERADSGVGPHGQGQAGHPAADGPACAGWESARPP